MTGNGSPLRAYGFSELSQLKLIETVSVMSPWTVIVCVCPSLFRMDTLSGSSVVTRAITLSFS